MSTSYDIRCLDSECEAVEAGLDDCRFRDALRLMIGEHRASLENCGAFLRDPASWWFTDMPSKLQVVLQFLADHHGHQLAVFDEYGEEVIQ